MNNKSINPNGPLIPREPKPDKPRNACYHCVNVHTYDKDNFKEVLELLTKREKALFDSGKYTLKELIQAKLKKRVLR